MVNSFFFGLPEPAAIVPAYRAIGPVASPGGDNTISSNIPILYPDVTIEEVHRDELIITEHPVEQGAAISDHAFKRPPEVIIRAGWSNSSPNTTSTNYAADVRTQLLTLQASRLPFDLYTGKQAYSQMLLAVLSTITDKDGEYALLATLVCRQVILVSTQTTSVPAQETTPGTETSETVRQTQPTSNQGPQSLDPAPNWNPNNYKIEDPTTGNALIDVPDFSGRL
jgi:hypothetical protein